MRLTETQRECLNDLRAACDAALRYDGCDFVRTGNLSGTEDTRSSRTLHSLRDVGYVQGKKHGASKQSQWVWRITKAGREALRAHPGEGGAE